MINGMKLRLASTLAALLLCIGPMAGATPRQTVTAAAERLRKAPSVTAPFTMRADGHVTEGSLVMSGNMFTLTSPGLSTWYDGSTQWTLSAQTAEVNIVTPTPDELRQVNPLAILSAFDTDYKAAALKAPKGCTAVSLTPTDSQAEIRRADITFSDATGWPTRIALTLTGNHHVVIDVHAVTQGPRLPVSAFRFDPKRHPGVEVIDLR